MNDENKESYLKTFWREDQERVDEHRNSPENERRRKLRLPEIPFPKPDPISKEKKLEALKKARRFAEIYLGPTNEDV